MRLEGKVAIVTGASRGIGLGIVEAFAAAGAKVIAGSRKLPEAGYPDGVQGVELDVADPDHWARVTDAVLAEHGRIDVLVNNAGIIAYEPLEELDLESWHRVVGVNQTGVFLGMKSVIPAMKKQGKGSIINVSSIWGNAAVPGAHAYHATKGAVLMMTRNAAITYVGDGIRVNSMLPGFIDTPLTQSQDPEVNKYVVGLTPLGRAGTPAEIANGCVFLASDESSFMTGADLVIDGGYLAQ
ncbi:Short-chain dehydrogenase/reductase SDR [Oceanicola granulosus HTCC2516]|uniref:Short-chain dehydrogenase/reductase SDR n=1 Tax=Oceanicola granulosus (strain ATCC BAA-861 / DSM 15982 / KCTC 12143 / HTCC2516) TaxID=314256 RepID=Q2CGV8_OCEGH|nr:glucose 1-dehydrogenase [Oceanicola granulosus]EAR51827.1 Short-chain dehydrogenase/reductase SDR [Oceanicola granulosus HTCC2516]